MTFILHNIRSAWNVGSAFRTAECLGSNLILTGYTPRPVGQNLRLIAKTAIGAEKRVQYESFCTAAEIFEKYRNGLHLAAEINQNSKSIYEFLNQSNTQNLHTSDIFLWFGNEISGAEKNVLDMCSCTLHLPLYGTKESLNVATSIAAFGYLFDFWIKKEAIY